MSTELAVIKNIPVVQETDGRVHWESGAAVDADGANGQNGNPIVRRKAQGVVIGCRARATYKGASVDAVVADISGADDIGELSIAAAKALNFENPSPRNGGVGSGVLFEFWPGQPATVNGETYVL